MYNIIKGCEKQHKTILERCYHEQRKKVKRVKGNQKQL